MFVRNNILCPFCGKSRTFDVYRQDKSSSSLVLHDFRVECSVCLGFREERVSFAVAACAVLAATEWMPKRDPMRRAHTWSHKLKNGRISPFYLRRLDHVSRLVFVPDWVVWQSADHVTVKVLCASLLLASGSPILHLRPAWLGPYRDYDKGLVPDFSSLGQPLAS